MCVQHAKNIIACFYFQRTSGSLSDGSATLGASDGYISRILSDVDAKTGLDEQSVLEKALNEDVLSTRNEAIQTSNRISGAVNRLLNQVGGSIQQTTQSVPNSYNDREEQLFQSANNGQKRFETNQQGINFYNGVLHRPASANNDRIFHEPPILHRTLENDKGLNTARLLESLNPPNQAKDSYLTPSLNQVKTIGYHNNLVLPNQARYHNEFVPKPSLFGENPRDDMVQDDQNESSSKNDEARPSVFSNPSPNVFDSDDTIRFDYGPKYSQGRNRHSGETPKKNKNYASFPKANKIKVDKNIANSSKTHEKNAHKKHGSQKLTNTTQPLMSKPLVEINPKGRNEKEGAITFVSDNETIIIEHISSRKQAEKIMGKLKHMMPSINKMKSDYTPLYGNVSESISGNVTGNNFPGGQIKNSEKIEKEDVIANKTKDLTSKEISKIDEEKMEENGTSDQVSNMTDALRKNTKIENETTDQEKGVSNKSNENIESFKTNEKLVGNEKSKSNDAAQKDFNMTDTTEKETEPLNKTNYIIETLKSTDEIEKGGEIVIKPSEKGINSKNNFTVVEEKVGSNTTTDKTSNNTDMIEKHKEDLEKSKANLNDTDRIDKKKEIFDKIKEMDVNLKYTDKIKNESENVDMKSLEPLEKNENIPIKTVNKTENNQIKSNETGEDLMMAVVLHPTDDNRVTNLKVINNNDSCISLQIVQIDQRITNKTGSECAIKEVETNKNRIQNSTDNNEVYYQSDTYTYDIANQQSSAPINQTVSQPHDLSTGNISPNESVNLSHNENKPNLQNFTIDGVESTNEESKLNRMIGLQLADKLANKNNTNSSKEGEKGDIIIGNATEIQTTGSNKPPKYIDKLLSPHAMNSYLNLPERKNPMDDLIDVLKLNEALLNLIHLTQNVSTINEQSETFDIRILEMMNALYMSVDGIRRPTDLNSKVNQSSRSLSAMLELNGELLYSINMLMASNVEVEFSNVSQLNDIVSSMDHLYSQINSDSKQKSSNQTDDPDDGVVVNKPVKSEQDVAGESRSIHFEKSGTFARNESVSDKISKKTSKKTSVESSKGITDGPMSVLEGMLNRLKASDERHVINHTISEFSQTEQKGARITQEDDGSENIAIPVYV